ncbi:MAG: ABC transporter permease subunit [Patescibacteria group bacterium]|nr:ABC transporter permease subunit [Patescibacteria group bacterium]
MNNNPIFIIAKKEYTDAIKNVLFLTLLLFLFILVSISLLVTAFNFQSQVAQYNTAIAQLKSMGQTGAILEKPQYFPLQMLRGTIEYLEIIGAIIGIILGYICIAKEKGNNTMLLLLSRPVTKTSFIGGKILGNSLLILSLLGLILIFIISSISGIGHVFFSSIELLKLFLAFLFSYIYLMFFFCLSALLSIFFKNIPNALIVSFAIWLLIILIIPQIGDTMDPDNQIPGGFFNSMHMTKIQQNEVISKFRTYETFRNALEESSVEKHYERLVFATLGIKDIYNGKSLNVIFKDKWGDFIWISSYYVGSILLAFALFKNKRVLEKMS